MEPDTLQNPTVLLVGEAPGATEDRKDRPFVGKSGKFLRDMVEDELLLNCAYTNTIRCRPPDNATPTTRQLKLCQPFLFSDLEVFKDVEVVVLLGNSALKSATGYSGITSWRGRQLQKNINGNSFTFLPTFHPAAVLPGRGNPERLDQWMSDLADVSEMVEGVLKQPADAHYEYMLVNDMASAKVMFAEIKEAGRVAFDLEFVSLQAFVGGNEIIMASFATKDKAWAIPIYHPESGFLGDEFDIIELLEEFATDDEIKKIGHNIKIDHLIMLSTLGTEVHGVDGDTMLLSQVVDSRKLLHDLAQLASKYLNMVDYDQELRTYLEEHPEADPKQGGSYAKVPLDILWLYAAKDASATYLLESILLDMLDAKQRVLYEQLVLPCSDTFTRIEANGCKPDIDIIEMYDMIYEEENAALLQKLRRDKDVIELEKQMNGISDKSREVIFTDDGRISTVSTKSGGFKMYNPNSSQQTAKLLYDIKGHPVLGLTKKKKPSVAADVIADLNDPWLDEYRLWKLYASARSKYLTKMPGWIDADGRIRSEYSIVGAETGRTSSKKPNLQNIPTPEKEPGTLLEEFPIKNAFTHTWDGGCIYAVDYKAVEMRMMATLSRSKRMVEMFNAEADPHTFVCAQLNKIPESRVTKELRYRAKWVNWTMLFGGSWKTLVRLYRIPEEEARDLVDGWYAIFPEVLEFYAAQVDFTKKHGYSVSPLGRRRYIPYITNAPDKQRLEAERQAANHPIQSSASDLLLMSIVVIDNVMLLHNMNSMIINTVHDSVVFDVYPGELKTVHELCEDVMCNLESYANMYFPGVDLSWITIPLRVDGEYGSHYGDMKHYVN
jgi:DNA polymerase-1